MRRIIPVLLFLVAAASAQTTPNADDVAKRAIENLAGPAWD